jgi:hypothetical protein
MRIEQRLAKLEDRIYSDDPFARLSDEELNARILAQMTPERLEEEARLAANAPDPLLRYQPGMNLRALSDAQLAAIFFNEWAEVSRK